jgi:hypothetical protein
VAVGRQHLAVPPPKLGAAGGHEAAPPALAVLNREHLQPRLGIGGVKRGLLGGENEPGGRLFWAIQPAVHGSKKAEHPLLAGLLPAAARAARRLL